LYPSLGSTQSNTVTFLIDNTTPAQVTDFRLNPASDTGIVGDNVTSDRTPQFIGTAGAGDKLELFQLISFTGTLTSGLPTVTGLSSTTGLAAGQAVTGTGIPSGTTILSVSSSTATIMLSENATVSNSESLTATVPVVLNTAIAQPMSFSGTLTSGSASVTGISSTTGLVAGQNISGTGIPSGTTILSVNSSTAITLSAEATASGSQSLTALTNDANGKPYDFSIQLPFTLTNGTIELGVIVVDVLSGNASPLSNPVTVAIVSVGSDYNADSYADAALYSRGITFTGTLTKGSASVTGISSTTGLVAGASVTGTGVPSGTTILTVNSSTAITLSANATVTGSQSLTAPNLGQWLVQTTLLAPTSPAPPPFWFTSGTSFGPANVIPFQGDFDGDGYTDLAYYQSSTATWYMDDSKSNAVSSFALGTPNSSLPVVGYFDANAPEEAAVFTINAQGQGVWTIVSAFTGIRTVTFGQTGDIPVPGSYDGLGYDQIAVYRPSTGNFYVLEPNGNTETLKLGVGSSADLTSLVPVPGQYDNSTYYQEALLNPNTIPNTPILGHTEAAVFDPITGVFTILGPSGIYTVPGFQKGDVPAPADYLGDGSTQPVIFRPSTGQFIEAGGTVIATFSQASADIPLAAPLSYRVPSDSPTPTPTPTPQQTLITPTVGFASGNSITVLGTIYAIGRQPWFVGTTSPGVTVDLILGGSHVIGGAKIVGVVVTNAAGDFSFHLPAGIKNGSYTMEARALSPSGSSYKLSVPVAFKVGPAPHIKPASKPPAKPKSTKPVKAVTSKTKVVQVQPRAVQPGQAVTTSGSNGHLIDQAVHTLVEERLFKKKGR